MIILLLSSTQVFSETFDEFSWDPLYGCREEDDIYDGQTPYDPPTFSCTTLLSSFVENGCSPTGTNYFTGGNTMYHSTASPSSWILANAPAGGPLQPQSHEMFTLKGDTSTISVEFQWHGEASTPCGTNSHVVLASHESFEKETCNPNNTCMDCFGNVGPCTVGIGESGCTQDNSFYAVIAGGFGGNGLPYNSCGFVIEKAQQYYEEGVWKRRVSLFPSTYLPFPLEYNTWYKMQLQEFSDALQYVAYKWNNNHYEFIGSFTMPLAHGFILPQTSTAGIYGYWLEEGTHVDFNNFHIGGVAQ